MSAKNFIVNFIIVKGLLEFSFKNGHGKINNITVEP